MTTTAPHASLPGRLLREPLLHFLLLGLVIFAVDHQLSSRRDDPRVIVVDGAVEKEVTEIFQDAKGRAPSPEELKVLVQRWIDNEVLYREGVALAVDQGDEMIRERIIFKSLNVVQSNLTPPPATEEVLREWFERNRARFDLPRRYDFEEAVLVGDTSEAAVRAFAEALRRGAASTADAGLRTFKGRPKDNIVTSFGAEFEEALAALPRDQWQVIAGTDGLHVVRLLAIGEARTAEFGNISTEVRQQWIDETMARLRTEAVRELAKKYDIRREAA
jgi:hypothetical protein